MTSTNDAAPRSLALQRALDATLAFEPEYGSGLSNHLPMALGALHALGAGPDRLEAFARSYAVRLRLRAPRAAAAPGTGGWGCIEQLPALERGMAAALTGDGVDAALRSLLPRLLPGAAAAAFHGLIRVAYAVQAGHAGELAAALAYWAARYRELPADAAGGAPLPLGPWLAALARLPAPAPGGLIVDRMAAVAANPGFRDLGDRLALDEATLPGLSRFAACAWLATRSFTVLHLVTSGHALRLLRPWLPSQEAAARAYVRAYTAALVASGADVAAIDRSPRLAPALDWPEIARRACASDDDHAIKLVYSCRELADDDRDPVYQAVAALAVG